MIEKIVNGKLNDYIDEFKNALKGFQNTNEQIDNFIKNVNTKIADLEQGQIVTVQMLKTAFSNDKELVRLGVASEVNKLANKMTGNALNESKNEKTDAV